MRYLLMIAGDEDTTSPDPTVTEAYVEWTKEAAERGILQGGERLRPTTDATTVRVRNGETLTTDGPFAETKEQLLGFYIIEADSLDEAIDSARRIKGDERGGAFEVRPLRVFEPNQTDFTVGAAAK